MYKGNGAYPSPRVTTTWRGRFIDGVWQCDCDPRLPAERFQTKKKGVNHGRWFYTCQQPQHKRCKFFLWEDDAQVREKHVVLSNSRSEPDTPKKTPSKSAQFRGGLLTPKTATVQTGRRWGGRDEEERSPTRRPKSKGLSSDEETYSWDESLEGEIDKFIDSPIKQPVFSPETPRKTPRTATVTSPNKRKLADVGNDVAFSPTVGLATPSSQFSSQLDRVPFSSVEISMTPTPRRYTNVLSAQTASDISELATQTLSLLDRHDVVIPTEARDDLLALLERHHLKTQGIMRGREISRVALKKKDEQIQELNKRIEGLESEREMDRAVIADLKSHDK